MSLSLARPPAARSPAGNAIDTFANPIAAGADPWIIWHEGFHYSCSSHRDCGVAVCRSERLTERGEEIVVWRAPERGPHSREIWAPELHRLDGRWYIHVAASNGRNETHRMIVLESVGEHPTSEFRFKAQLYTGDHLATGQHNSWAIDGTVLEHRGRRYLIWSGWEGACDEQWLYIATMSNAWTVSSNRVRLCANDDFVWERLDETSASRGLNEGPQVLARNGRVFVVYSASASWEITYKLGMLELAPDGDPMDPRCWRKHAAPVFRPTVRTWGVGHNCFVKSPDGREDWLVHHAKVERRPNWNRVIHAQPFGWDAGGRPVFGEPIGAGVAIARPSGEVTAGPERVTADGRRDGTDGSEVAFGRAALAAVVGEEPMVRNVKVLGVGAKAGG